MYSVEFLSGLLFAGIIICRDYGVLCHRMHIQKA
jgi:hypothetical protein